MDQRLAFRRDMTRRQGASALDVVLPVYECGSCGRSVDDPALRTVGQVSYRDLGGLLGQARDVSAQIVRATTPRCPECGRRARLARVDYHAWHEGLERDLVVRRVPSTRLLGRTRQELFLWDDEAGYTPFRDLDELQAKLLTRDALLRQVALWLERGETRETVSAIAEAADALAGDPALLTFIPFLLECSSATGLAGGIVEAHVVRRPEDPEGHYWLGRVVLDLVRRGAWPPSRLETAREHLETCLQLDPEHPRAAAVLDEAQTFGPGDEEEDLEAKTTA